MTLIYRKDNHHYIQCPHCENEILFEEEKLLNVFKNTPWWVYASALAAIASMDWSFFLEFIVYSVLKVFLLLLGVWAVGVILSPIATIFTDLFSKKEQKVGGLKKSKSH